eukprot:4007161-Amphidinium_carterae.1
MSDRSMVVVDGEDVCDVDRARCVVKILLCFMWRVLAPHVQHTFAHFGILLGKPTLLLVRLVPSPISCSAASTCLLMFIQACLDSGRGWKCSR